jgi:hypothetical protein
VTTDGEPRKGGAPRDLGASPARGRACGQDELVDGADSAEEVDGELAPLAEPLLLVLVFDAGRRPRKP